MIHLVHSLMHYFPSVDHPADYSAEPEIYLPLKNVFWANLSYKEIAAAAAAAFMH